MKKDGYVTENETEHGLLLLFALLMGLLWLSGCSSGQKIDHARQARFKTELRQCTEAIKSGNLDKAKTLLVKVDKDASNHDEKRKAQSLAKLVTGADALMDGNAKLARAEWSNIADPRLARQVRVKASLIDINVPLQPVQKRKEIN